MQEDFDAVVNAFAAAGGGTVDVSLDVETIRNYHSDVFDDFNNLPPQTWTAYTPTLVVADADALWDEILSAESFWGELATGIGVMGHVIDATPLLFRPAYEVVATYLHLGPAAGQAAPVAGPAGKAIMQGLADLSLSGSAALAHEWLDDMLFDRVGAQAMVEASFTETFETLKDALGLGRSLSSVSGPEGTSASELVLVGEGRDTLMGGAGNDVIHADALQSYLLDAFPDTDPWLTGGDAIDGGDGNDVLTGGAGHDYLLDDEGDNLLLGGAGNDVLDAMGADTLAGGAGNDLIIGGWNGAGQTVLFGEGDGLDLVHMSLRDHDRVVIDGDVASFVTYDLYGADYPVLLIRLSSGDQIYFPEASHSIYPLEREQPVSIFADNGSWTRWEALSVAEDNQALIDALDLNSCGEGAAAPGGDLSGGAGPDTLAGWSTADRLAGAGGNDLLTGAGRWDALDGDAGDDTLFGGNEADTLAGGAGNDTARGDAGDDTLLPDAGTDTLDGGAGQDWIDASAASSTVHTIDLMLGKLVGLGAQDVVQGVEHIVAPATAKVSSATISPTGSSAAAATTMSGAMAGSTMVMARTAPTTCTAAPAAMCCSAATGTISSTASGAMTRFGATGVTTRSPAAAAPTASPSGPATAATASPTSCPAATSWS